MVTLVKERKHYDNIFSFYIISIYVIPFSVPLPNVQESAIPPPQPLTEFQQFMIMYFLIDQQRPAIFQMDAYSPHLFL